ncbi:hypothetical protein ACFL42_02600 [Candidatus Omnitrophota bacterium]
MKPSGPSKSGLPARLNLLAAVFLIAACSFTGCGPTYMEEDIEDAIIDICKREYDIDVKVTTIGKTIAIYLPLHNLLDFTFTVTKESSEKINDVLLSVTRVAISTNADFDFYCVIAHDVRLPEIQIVIVKSVEDVKRFLLSDVSRGDYSKRMLIDLRMNPQAKKEKVITNVFDKMDLDDEWQEELLNDFFRSEPAGLGEIGYWNDRFFIKDVMLSEFIAEQIASRLKLEFREDKEISDKLMLKTADGKYVDKDGEQFFVLEILAAARDFKDVDTDFSDIIFKNALKVAAYVIHAYKFEAFEYIDIENLKERRSLGVSRANLELFRKKKINLDKLMKEKKYQTEALF